MIVRKSCTEIVRMRRDGRVVVEILQMLREKVQPGVTTYELDQFAERQCLKWKAKPAFKGYGGFPFTICASLNDQVVHSFANKQPLMVGLLQR